MDNTQLENIFTYHAPSPVQQEAYVALRQKALELAMLVNTVCPESREKSLAITNIQQAVMFGNASIAIHSK